MYHHSRSSSKPHNYRRGSSSSQHHYSSSSSSSSSSSRSQQSRPRLLRSSATEPSVTPSDEMQASLVAPNSPHTAADLLTRMAYIPPSCDLGQSLTSSSSSSSVAEPIMIERGDARKRSESSDMMSTPENSVSGCYFSFPNFENWDSQQDGDKQSYS